MAVSSYRIGWFAAAAILALRVAIGVHFLSEGLTKLGRPQPFSAAFLTSAKGPLARLYHSLVWDADGEYRLDLAATLEAWNEYRSRIADHFGFDDQQMKAAEQAVKTYEARVKQFFSSKSEAIDEYRKWLDRRRDNADRSKYPERELASLQTHDARIAGEARKLYNELIPPLDQLWRDLENSLNSLATQEQWERHGRLAITRPGRWLLDSESLDTIIPWFDVSIGACLILGLFTRTAALLGAAFLASICMSQWPGSPGAVPIYNQLVEMLALLVLAAVGAGRFLGIDFLFAGLKELCCPSKSTGDAK